MYFDLSYKVYYSTDVKVPIADLKNRHRDGFFYQPWNPYSNGGYTNTSSLSQTLAPSIYQMIFYPWPAVFSVLVCSGRAECYFPVGRGISIAMCIAIIEDTSKDHDDVF